MNFNSYEKLLDGLFSFFKKQSITFRPVLPDIDLGESFVSNDFLNRNITVGKISPNNDNADSYLIFKQFRTAFHEYRHIYQRVNLFQKTDNELYRKMAISCGGCEISNLDYYHHVKNYFNFNFEIDAEKYGLIYAKKFLLENQVFSEKEINEFIFRYVHEKMDYEPGYVKDYYIKDLNGVKTFDDLINKFDERIKEVDKVPRFCSYRLADDLISIKLRENASLSKLFDELTEFHDNSQDIDFFVDCLINEEKPDWNKKYESIKNINFDTEKCKEILEQKLIIDKAQRYAEDFGRELDEEFLKDNKNLIDELSI